MARRLIGLDVGTHAVRVAEIQADDPPLLTSFGQVALPPDAMRDGEVVDTAAVTAAISRLWRELGLRRGAEVRIGVASPRVLVRTLDMPSMPDSDLAGALRFQAQELIPIPLDEAILDFQVIEQIPVPAGAPEDARPMSRVLLAAAHRDTIENLLAAVRGAGLRVGAVDLVPLALVRALGRHVADDGPGTEAIVSVGGGVTVVVVHEGGIPRFVRILGTGGRAITDAIATEGSLSAEQAEALKRGALDATDEMRATAEHAAARPLDDLVEQIRGSLDYYRTQPDALPILRVALTGGATLQPELQDRLASSTGLIVVPAEPRTSLAIGDIGFPPEQVPALDPFLPVPVGLALGGVATGKRINLVGDRKKARNVPADRRTIAVVAAVVAAVLVIALGALTLARSGARDTEKKREHQAENDNASLQAQIAQLQGASSSQSQVDAIRTQVKSVLATDVSWPTVLQAVARTIPNDTWLTQFQGASTVPKAGAAGVPAPAPTTGASGSAATPAATTAGPSGTITFAAQGLDFTSVAGFIQRIGQIPALSNLWVSSASRTGGTTSPSSAGSSGSTTSTPQTVTFTATATITPQAASDRIAQYTGDSGSNG